MARVTVAADKSAMSEAAAERVSSLIEAAIGERGRAAVSLTGGDTPDLLYQMLADDQRPWRRRVDWPLVHLFWGDEREVPPDHPDSNYGLAKRTLLQHVTVQENQINRMRGELPASDAGRLYDAVLRGWRDQAVGPLFDVMLLGIGSNVHIASIFPNSPLLMEKKVSARTDPRPHLLATGVEVPELSQWRITMTPAALLDSAHIIMIASGASKADAIEAAIERPLDVQHYPAQLLHAADDRVEWIMDSAAASRLHGAPRA
jgi:6-phosphogluconolactonase